MKVGRPTAVCIRVVHMAPGPTLTFTTSTPASISACVPSAVHTLPATKGTSSPTAARTSLMASSMRRWCPWAVSSTRTSTPAAHSAMAWVAALAEMPTAAATISSPLPLKDGLSSSRRTASSLVMMPRKRPLSSTTGAAFTRSVSMNRYASRLDMPARSVAMRRVITSLTGVY